MKLYESKNLELGIKEIQSFYKNENIFLEVQTCFEGSISHGASININDIINDTDFFKKCIVKEYQELLKKVYALKWSLDISSILFDGENVYIIVKVIGS